MSDQDNFKSSFYSTVLTALIPVVGASVVIYGQFQSLQGSVGDLKTLVHAESKDLRLAAQNQTRLIAQLDNLKESLGEYRAYDLKLRDRIGTIDTRLVRLGAEVNHIEKRRSLGIDLINIMSEKMDRLTARMLKIEKKIDALEKIKEKRE